MLLFMRNSNNVINCTRYIILFIRNNNLLIKCMQLTPLFIRNKGNVRNCLPDILLVMRNITKSYKLSASDHVIHGMHNNVRNSLPLNFFFLLSSMTPKAFPPT